MQGALLHGKAVDDCIHGFTDWDDARHPSEVLPNEKLKLDL